MAVLGGGRALGRRGALGRPDLGDSPEGVTVDLDNVPACRTFLVFPITRSYAVPAIEALMVRPLNATIEVGC